ncbi:hypothetical protein T484DRAFT_1887417, partial [Baffinella frigidus]
MVNTVKMKKLGGFSEMLAGGRMAEGFARKMVPPDTPHREDKKRWRIDALGRAVPDEGIPQDKLRQLYIDAFLAEEDEEECADHVRSLGTMAEQGDFECAKVLLSWLATNKSANLRKQILRKLVFAAKTPQVANCREILIGIQVCIEDEKAAIRGMMLETLDFAAQKVDMLEIETLVPHSKRAETNKMRGRAWHKVRELGLALSQRTLMSCIISLFTHAVLPVRMSVWYLFYEALDTVSLSRCKEFERRMHRRRVAKVTTYQDLMDAVKKTEEAFREALEEGRETMAEMLEEDRMHAGIDVATLEMQMEAKDRVLVDDAAFLTAKENLEELKEKYLKVTQEFEVEFAQYSKIEKEIENMILSLFATLMVEPSRVLEKMSNAMGRGSQGHWYVRRCILTTITPFALDGDAKSIAMLQSAVTDNSPYVRRIAERSLRAIYVKNHERDNPQLKFVSSLPAVTGYVVVLEPDAEQTLHKKVVLDETTQMVRDLLDISNLIKKTPGADDEAGASPLKQPSKHHDAPQEPPMAASAPSKSPTNKAQNDEDFLDTAGVADEAAVAEADATKIRRTKSAQRRRNRKHRKDLEGERQETPAFETPEDRRRHLKVRQEKRQARDDGEALEKLNVADYDWREALEKLNVESAGVAHYDCREALENLSVADFDWREVRELVDTLRIHFLEATDMYKNSIKESQFDGKRLVSCTDEDLKQTLRMTLRKHRGKLRDAVKTRMDQFIFLTDPAKKMELGQKTLQDAARNAAKALKEVNTQIRDEKGGHNARLVMKAMRNDNYVFGDALGVGGVLIQDKDGKVIFNKVIPLGGLVTEGDILIEVAGINVEGKTLAEVKRILVDSGEQCTCVLRLGSQKERLVQMRTKYQEWQGEVERLRASLNVTGKIEAAFIRQRHQQIEELESTQLATDLLRTVRITCHTPPYDEELMGQMGPDVEVYPTDAVRALQLLTVMNRNGFSKYIRPVLLDSEVRSLHALAAKSGDVEWVMSLNMNTFTGLLARLAARFNMQARSSTVEVRTERFDATKEWFVIQGKGGIVDAHTVSKHRSMDLSKSVDEFRAFGRSAVKMRSKTEGLDYTVFYNPKHQVAVEFMHSSNGTIRVMLPASAPPPDLEDIDADEWLESHDEDEPQVWTVFPDGNLEQTRHLRAHNLLTLLETEDPVPPPQEEEEEEEAEPPHPGPITANDDEKEKEGDAPGFAPEKAGSQPASRKVSVDERSVSEKEVEVHNVP